MEQIITTDIQTIVDAISSIGFVGLLIILAIPKTRKFFGFNGDINEISENKQTQSTVNKEFKELLNAHAKRLDVANDEMGEMRDIMKEFKKDHSKYIEHIAEVRTDVKWIKDLINK